MCAGFDGEVRKANQSDIGKRNGGAMLSMQVRWPGCWQEGAWFAGALGLVGAVWYQPGMY